MDGVIIYATTQSEPLPVDHEYSWHKAGVRFNRSPRKTKIGTELDHVTRDSNTTFKVKRSEVNLLLMS